MCSPLSSENVSSHCKKNLCGFQQGTFDAPKLDFNHTWPEWHNTSSKQFCAKICPPRSAHNNFWETFLLLWFLLGLMWTLVRMVRFEWRKNLNEWAGSDSSRIYTSVSWIGIIFTQATHPWKTFSLILTFPFSVYFSPIGNLRSSQDANERSSVIQGIKTMFGLPPPPTLHCFLNVFVASLGRATTARNSRSLSLTHSLLIHSLSLTLSLSLSLSLSL